MTATADGRAAGRGPGGPARGALLAAVLAAAALRVLVLAATGPLPQADTGAYLQVARNLAATGEFAAVDAVTGAWTPYAFRMPLFHALAALLMKVFGPDVAWPLAAVNLVLSVAVVAAAAWMGALLAGARGGVVAGLLMAASPNALYHTPALLTDTLFCFLMTASLVTGLRLLQRPTAPLALAWGLLIGLAAMTRPVLKFYWPAVAVALVLVVRPRRRAARLAAAVAIGSLAVLAPWYGRNVARLGFAGLELNTGLNTLWSTIDLVDPPTPAERAADPLLAQVRDIVAAHDAPLPAMDAARRATGLSLVEADALFARIGFETARRRPLAVLGRVARNAANFVTSPASVMELAALAGWREANRPAAELRREGSWLPLAVNLVPRALWLLLAAVAAAAVLRGLRDPAPRSLLFLLLGATVLYHLALTSAVAGYDRYRLAVEPALFALAACGIVRPRGRPGAGEGP